MSVLNAFALVTGAWFLYRAFRQHLQHVADCRKGRVLIQPRWEDLEY